MERFIYQINKSAVREGGNRTLNRPVTAKWLSIAIEWGDSTSLR